MEGKQLEIFDDVEYEGGLLPKCSTILFNLLKPTTAPHVFNSCWF